MIRLFSSNLVIVILDFLVMILIIVIYFGLFSLVIIWVKVNSIISFWLIAILLIVKVNFNNAVQETG